ncbi:MAG TPA: hypothetical protein H9857_08520 [Candidatus Desulfovibrio intestinigallinarum]|nr:hypothetical protein [Candidatus Desulfovibrio intestinigallinarum]
MSAMGFLAADKASSLPLKETDTSGELLRFDNGLRVTFAEGCHNMLVTGTTGAGKTTSIILPAMDRLIGAGFGGVIVDVKGSLADSVRKLAARHGRLGDVVEFGPGPGARKINLFHGVDSFRFRDLLRSLLLDSANRDDRNIAFAMSGLRCLTQAYQMLLLLSRAQKLRLNFDILRRLINDHYYALRVYHNFKKEFEKTNIPEAEELMLAIEGDKMHIIPHDEKKQLRDNTWNEQVAYRLSVIRSAVENLCNAPGIKENFISSRKENIDIADRIYHKKQIVVLRLAPETGVVGAGLVRILLQEFYTAVLRHGSKLPENEYTFCIADEAQHFLSTDRTEALNDNQFIAVARESRNINILGTQSLSSLYARTHDEEAIRTIVSNCNVRLFLYSDDMRTRELSNICRQKPLEELQPGEVVLAKFNTFRRSHQYATASVQDMYNETQQKLAAVQDIPLPPVMPEKMPGKAALRKRQQRQRALEDSYVVKSGPRFPDASVLF